ncbi:ABC transporter permease [Thalassotalea fusca]
MTSSIGLTLGALVCALTLVYLMVYHPLSFPKHQQLHLLTATWLDDMSQPQSKGIAHEQAEYLYKQRSSDADIALSYNITDVITSLPSQPAVETNYVTDNWFQMLDVGVHIGDLPQMGKSLDDVTPQALISYQLWQSHFAGQREVIGESITIRGINHKIVGVMEASYRDPEIFDIGRDVDVWLNWNLNWSKQMGWQNWQDPDEAVRILFMSPPDKKNNQAAMLNSLLNEAWTMQVANVSGYDGWSLSLNAIALQTAIYGDQSMLIYMTSLACLGLFVICIANTTNLLLARTIEQHFSLSIQAALGARPKHIKQAILAEILVIMFFTLPVSLMTTAAGFQVVQIYLADLMPRANELMIGSSNVLLTLSILLVVSAIFTFLCARVVNYRQLNSALASSGKGVSAQISQRTRRNLIISQVSIASLLLFVNINIMQSAIQSVIAPSTLSLDDRWQLRLTAQNPTLMDKATTRQSLDEFKSALQMHPAVAQVSQSLSPLIWSGTFPFVMVDSNEQFSPQAKFIDEEYFSVLDQPLIEGDNFTRDQIRARDSVVIVNDVLAQQLSPSGTVIGKQMQFWGRHHTIIGVVKGTKKPNELHVPPMRYTPDRGERPVFIVQFKAGHQLSKAAMLQFIEQATSQFTLFSYSELKSDHDRLLFAEYTSLVISIVLTILTVFLAGIGLYGVLEYSSQMRKREFGTRFSLGAKRVDIIRLALVDNGKPVIAGITLSALIIGLLSPWQGYILPNLNASHILLAVFCTVASCVSIGAISSYLPVRAIINQPISHSLKG